jgi:hypothetical protein
MLFDVVLVDVLPPSLTVHKGLGICLSEFGPVTDVRINRRATREVPVSNLFVLALNELQ